MVKRGTRATHVSPELWQAVMLRDQRCFLAKVEPDHLCYDVWDRPHGSDDLDRLTLEHVKEYLMMGRRAPSDERHLVALCGAANLAVPSRAQRDLMRVYLRETYPGWGLAG